MINMNKHTAAIYKSQRRPKDSKGKVPLKKKYHHNKV